jgi:putative Mg2+ transporter-C (MgtC) family protein
MLVSFGAALFTIIPLQAGTSHSSYDAISRVIQGIAAGVGFLGAGEILRVSSDESQESKVHGLTSAAAIWVSAALGIAAGCGLWQTGLIGALLCFLILKVVKKWEKDD